MTEGEVTYQAIVVHHACVSLVGLLAQTEGEAIRAALGYMRRTVEALDEAPPGEDVTVARERTLLLCNMLASLAGDVETVDTGDDSSDDEAEDDSPEVEWNEGDEPESEIE